MQPAKRSFRFRRPTRLCGYDYRLAGAYFVTLCADRQLRLFGEIRNDEMVLTDLGNLVNAEWRQIAIARKNVELDLFVVMPNHLHGIIFIKDDLHSHADASSHRQTTEQKGTLKSGSLGAIISQFKAGVTRRARATQINGDAKIWQRNYYDRIVRDEDSLNQIRQYILTNPARWREDSLYAE